MERLSSEELKRLANFFNNLAVAWLTASVIVPTFSFPIDIATRVLYLIVGGFATYVCLAISLGFAREVKK